MPIDKKKCIKVRDQMLETINGAHMTRFESVYILAQLFIDIGMSIQGYTQLPSIDDLTQKYYLNKETVAFGDTMILNGLQTQIALADLDNTTNKETR